MADSPENANEHGSITSAIVAVMKSLGTLSKDNQNKFDKYEYASIDDFILFVRMHIADAGIVVEQDELEAKLVDVTKKDGKTMAMWWAQYAFTLHHEKGELGPIRKTVMVQANGAQASGSAQSYALKQFFRAQFLIPTGDKDDPDKVKTEISAQGQQQTDLQKKAGKIRDLLLKADTVEMLDVAWSDNSVTIDEVKRTSEVGYNFLKGEYDRKKNILEKV